MIQNMTSYRQLDSLLSFLLAQHLPGKDITLTVCHNAQILRHYSTPEVELQALLTPAGVKGWYVMYIAEGLPDPESIACHEFAHLTQMVSGRLSCDYQRGLFLWQGRTWTAATRYEARPWEQEAFSLQGRFFRSFKRYSNTIRNEKH